MSLLATLYAHAGHQHADAGFADALPHVLTAAEHLFLALCLGVWIGLRRSLPNGVLFIGTGLSLAAIIAAHLLVDWSLAARLGCLSGELAVVVATSLATGRLLARRIGRTAAAVVARDQTTD